VIYGHFQHFNIAMMAEIWLQEWGDTSCHQNPTQVIRKQHPACFWEVGGALQGSI